MKLVQVYDTQDGENYNAGFTTFRSMVDFWKKAIAIHKENYDVYIYTDQYGADKIDGIIDANIVVVDFEFIDDRYWNIAKLQTHLYQDEEYIMVDIDVILNKAIKEFDTDVMCEMTRGGAFGLYSGKFGLSSDFLKAIPGIPCSGLLGFKDPEFAKEYAAQAIDKIKNTQLNSVTFETMWHIEEIFLGNKIYEKGLSLSTFGEEGVDYIHLQGGRK